MLKSTRRSNPQELIYAQSLEISPGLFRNLKIISDSSNDKLVLVLAPTLADKTGDSPRRDGSPRARTAF